MDIENLDAGQEFSELPDTYTIFITEKDFYGQGEPAYVFRTINEKTGEPFNDGTTIIYVNGEYRGDDALGQLMHDFNCNNAGDMHYELLAEKTKYYKENQEGVQIMCKALEDMTREAEARGEARGKALGEARGKAYGTFQTFLNLISDGLLTVSQAAAKVNLTEKQFNEKLTELGLSLS